VKLDSKGNQILVILIIIFSIFLVFYFDMHKTNNTYNLNNLEVAECKGTYRDINNYFYQENVVLLEVKNEYKAKSIFPEFQNIFCIGKVIDYEISFYEEIDDIEYVKIKLYTFSGQRLVNYVKLLILFFIFNPIFIKNKKFFDKEYMFLFFIFTLFVLNYFLLVEFSFSSFLSETIFFLCIYTFIYSENSITENVINKNHNLAIDSLRALAVIFVLLNHLDFSLFSSGYLGVDLFFVISGYVITKKYYSLEYSNFKQFYSDFLFFRVKRILPVLFFFILVTSIFVYFLDFYYKDTLLLGLFSSLAVSNIYLYFSSSDYFSIESSLNSFTHTWSLGVEEQFYILFPVILYLIKRKKSNKFLFVCLVLLSYILFWIYQPDYQFATYYLLPFRFWQIGLGCLAVIYSKEIYKFTKRIPLNLILILLLTTFLIDIPYSKYLTTINAIAAFFVINIVGGEYKTSIILNTKKLASIGALSYSIYLWHWPVVALSKWGSYENFNIELKLLLIILLSFISFKFVEQPFRKTPIEKKKIMMFGILFSLIFLSFTLRYTIENTDRNNILSGNNPTLFSESEYKNIINEISCYHPEDVESAFSRCMTYVENKINVYLIGDSHSTNHYLTLNEIFNKSQKYNLSHLVDWSFIRSFQGMSDCGVLNCIDDSFEKHITFYNKNLKEEDIVIISFSRDWFKEDGPLPRETNEVKIKKFENKLNELVKVLKNKGVKILFVGDIPKTCEPGTNYMNDVIKNGDIKKCTVERSVSLEDREEITEVLIKYSGEDIDFVDPHDYFCTNQYCSVVDLKSNKLLYTDLSPHISTEGLAKMNEFWTNIFETNIFSNS
tara:strand:- start:3907 stop:6408 length:2502 start_codon:yes stop_codon:yes gene_type:complete